MSCFSKENEATTVINMIQSVQLKSVVGPFRALRGETVEAGSESLEPSYTLSLGNLEHCKVCCKDFLLYHESSQYSVKI